MIRYRPLIGVTTQTLQSIDGIPEGLPMSVVMNQRYYLAAAAFGAVPVLIPLLDDLETLREIYDRLDGLLLPGGVDIDPALYGEARHEKVGRIDAARDRAEIQLAAWAIEDRKPLLGLCRGLQVLNVACGGTLYQDIAAQLPSSIKHDYFPTYGFSRDHLAHSVDVSPGSRLNELLGLSQISVNSMHHQGIKNLGAGLRATAVASDGMIEAAEIDDDSFIVGVQWHPEVFDFAQIETRKLFRGFIDAASVVGAHK